MGYLVRSTSAELLGLVQVRTGRDDITQEWLDSAVAEMLAYLVAGPAVCRASEWLTWDDLPDPVQAILVAVLARQAVQGQGAISEERIGDYAISYSDPALFEGRVPRYFNDGEEHALGRLSGCFSSLYSVAVAGIPIHDFSEVERSSQSGGQLPADKASP